MAATHAERIALMVEHWGRTLQLLGVDTSVDKKNPDFSAKNVYTYNNQKFICLYDREGEKKFYVELLDKGAPANPRKLYVFKGDPKFKEREEKSTDYGTALGRKVALSELTEVPMATEPVKNTNDSVPWLSEFLEEPVEKKRGIRMDLMTHRDFLAIMQGVPVADHDEINEDIRQLNR